MAACVVNVGGGIVHTVPYYEGLLIAHAIQRLDVSGQGKYEGRSFSLIWEDITDYVVEACRVRGDTVTAQEAENFKTAFWIVHEKEFKVAEEETGGECGDI